MIEGDGIGREVIPAAIGVIRRLELGLEFQPLNVGAERYLQTGEALPEEDFAQLETADAILLGAIGDPRITDSRYLWQTLGRIRRELDLYANVRPAKLLCGRLEPAARARPAARRHHRGPGEAPRASTAAWAAGSSRARPRRWRSRSTSAPSTG